MRRVLILGAGGQGRVVADLVRACGDEVAGFVDLDGVGRVVEPGGARVLLTQESFFGLLARGSFVEGATHAIVAIGRGDIRLSAHERLPLGRRLEPLVHPTAWVSPSAELGAGTVVLPRAVVHTSATLGACVIVNSGAVVEHDCVLGDGAHVAPGATLCGTVVVGERAWVGAGSVVIQNLTLGADVMVGAGAVVVRDVPQGPPVVGNPARRLLY